MNDGPMMEFRVRDAVGLKYMKLHLLKLIWSKLLCIYPWTFWMTRFAFSNASSIVLPSTKMLVSSAYRMNSPSLEQFTMSFT